MQQQAHQTRSDFVTVLAWIFIAVAGFGTFISLLQNIMLTFFFPLDKIRSIIQGPEGERIPTLFRFLFMNVRFFFLCILAISLSTLVSSIGLLVRKNWARLVFIGLMAFGIVWSLGMIFLQRVFFSNFPQIPVSRDPAFAENFSRMFVIMRVVMAIIALGMSALFCWIIKKIISPGIRAEFY